MSSTLKFIVIDNLLLPVKDVDLLKEDRSVRLILYAQYLPVLSKMAPTILLVSEFCGTSTMYPTFSTCPSLPTSGTGTGSSCPSSTAFNCSRDLTCDTW
jgi:hypothetical protein